ncbi:hypothetical protein LJ737_11110 [Hymenobacter sp. 15J16-1T3B]|uniref:hypothetical protein n=1 Tax=Hymenobacter sp. 15J16-1T3B TaxID=2886941 RepID=UPI001D0F581E|nr:hypothetical protein [Hymenobacter sp. 15J16-1T3B]MCC3157788.1 hypothetical protein [Hymenobacter sp. 15J16-1T3B]
MRRRLLDVRWEWLTSLGLGLLSACSPAADRQQRVAPVGRYEGTLTYRGAELPVVLNVYQDSASRLVQVQLRAPGGPPYARWFDSVAYRAPALVGRLPGGSRLALREEPNFLTGAVWLHDTLRAELVAVRRGAADLPAYTVTRQPAAGAAPAVLRYLPLDTAQHRPALLYWPMPGAAGAAYGWADWLAGQGVQVALASPTVALSDSVAAQQIAAALRRLRAEPRVDSGKVGVWATGPGGRAAVLSAEAARPRFLLVQGAAFGRADRAWLRQLSRQPVAVLGLYGALDTSLNVAISSQQLRNAVGRRRGSGVKVYQQANGALLLPARADSARRWPQPPPDLAPSLQQWLRGLH